MLATALPLLKKELRCFGGAICVHAPRAPSPTDRSSLLSVEQTNDTDTDCPIQYHFEKLGKIPGNIIQSCNAASQHRQHASTNSTAEDWPRTT